MTSRRNFLLGLGAALAAPAIIRTPGLLMPVRPMLRPWSDVPITATEIQLRRMKARLSDEITHPATYMAPDGRTYTMHNNGAVKALKAVDQMIEELRANPYAGREIIAADWPYRTITAPPGGFKVVA